MKTSNPTQPTVLIASKVYYALYERLESTQIYFYYIDIEKTLKTLGQ
jgi:hypothetical protein